MRRNLLVAALVIGLGLVAAPAIFQMFTRAPKGGEMIDEFRPYMAPATVDKFQRYMAEIDAADAELRAKLPSRLETRAGIPADQAASRFPSLANFEQQWPRIKADMDDDMLTKIEQMEPNFAAVDALPPFPLFPWFFVLPGALVVIAAALALRNDRRGRSPRPWVTAVAVLGAGIALAPAVFQMFTRAPKGAEMIDSFRPIMTTQRVTTVQGYFLVIGAAEGEIRTQIRPALAQSGDTDAQWAADMPATERFVRDWPKISTEFAPMIGAMSDNVDNYAAVDALPSFSLFPWFFVIPGLLICGLAIAARQTAGSGDGGEHEPRRRGTDRVAGTEGDIMTGTTFTLRRSWVVAVLAVMLLAGALAACGSDSNKDGASGGTSKTTAASGPQDLVGVFKIDAGTCTDAAVTAGSSFRMVQGGGTLDAGPFVPNGDSPCGDKTWNPLLPGTDGGLRTGDYQPFGDPVFDAGGNATSDKIVKVVKFFAVGFAVGTNEKDPQTGATTSKPKITVDNGKLTGDLRAFAAAWNKQNFNQGAPKPDGSRPGITKDPTGTYDPATKHYTLDWASQIVGGPFNNFTGVWHLEGTFEPAG